MLDKKLNDHCGRAFRGGQLIWKFFHEFLLVCSFLGQYQHDDDDNFANFFIKSTDENCPVVVNLSFVFHLSTDAPCYLFDEELLNCCCSYYFAKVSGTS